MNTITFEMLAFWGMVIVAIAAFIRAFWGWHKQLMNLVGWRKVAFQLGFIAVAGQLALFAISWTHVGTNNALFAAWARFVYPSFVVAVIFITAGKGTPRWWLLLSSFLLFVLCFFTMLSR